MILSVTGGGYLLSHFRSTIGVAGFNFSVRNGKRWSPRAVATLVSLSVRVLVGFCPAAPPCGGCASVVCLWGLSRPCRVKKGAGRLIFSEGVPLWSPRGTGTACFSDTGGAARAAFLFSRACGRPP